MVAEGVRGVTRGQTVALMLGLIAIFAVALVTGIGDESPLGPKESARGGLELPPIGE